MKRIYVTVDTECHDKDRENDYIWGKVGGKEYGIRMILEEGRKWGIPINFFFDMCESYRYGSEYAEKIISCIREYGQPIYLHLHPNYISGDDERTFLWQYSFDEQKDILKKGFAQYNELMGTDVCEAFRAGRYGVSADTYRAMEELGISTVDLSYGYMNGKMCHLGHSEVNTVNLPVEYRGQVIFPNTRFIMFDYLGKKKALNLDLHEICFGELKDVLRKCDCEDIVFTMHSWHFFDRFFYRKGIRGNRREIRRFEKIIRYCKSLGYEFSAINRDYFFEKAKRSSTNDKPINNCRTLWQKIKSFFYNFVRFQKMAKLNKKYFAIFGAFYLALIAAITAGALIVLL